MSGALGRLHPGHSLGQHVMPDVAAPRWLPVATGLEETVRRGHDLSTLWVMMRVHPGSESTVPVLLCSARAC